MEDAELERAEVPRPQSHRRPGPATFQMPSHGEPPTFGQAFAKNPREVLVVATGTLVSVIWGVSAVLDGPGLGNRLLGLVSVLAGLLLAVSYALQFFPQAAAWEGWQRSRLRRATWAVLDHAWVAFLTVGVAWLIVAGLGWLAGRIW